jgi:hypothetical protein
MPLPPIVATRVSEAYNDEKRKSTNINTVNFTDVLEIRIDISPNYVILCNPFLFPLPCKELEYLLSTCGLIFFLIELLA